MTIKCGRDLVFNNDNNYCQRCKDYQFCFKLAENEAKSAWMNEITVDDGDKLISGSTILKKESR